MRQCVTSTRREDISESCVELLLRLLKSRKRQLMHFLEHSQIVTLTSGQSHSSCLKSSSQLNSSQVLNIPVQFQIDTGAEVTVISEQEWKKIGRPPVSPATRKLRCPDAHTLQVTEMFTASLESDSRRAEGEIYVVRGLTKS